VITITLIVFISQFRGQEKAIREASYQGLMGRYNEFVSSLIEKPELAKFLMDDPADSPAGQDPIVYANMLMAFGIIEKAFLLYQKGWIDKDTRTQWSTWLETLAGRPEFRSLHSRAAGTFDPRFENYVRDLIKRADTEKASTK
jgi:hypothetical protein